MAGINLLPQEYKPSGYVISAAKTLKKIALITILGLIITLIFFIGTYAFYKKKLDDSTVNKISYEMKIKALEETETRLIFIKDRIGKISEASNIYSTSLYLKLFNEIFDLYPEGALLKDTTVNTDGVLISTGLPDLNRVTEYLANIINSGKFTKVSLESFSFDIETGYVVSLKIAN